MICLYKRHNLVFVASHEQRKTDVKFEEKLHRQRSLFLEVHPIPLNLFELLLFLSMSQALLSSISPLQLGDLQTLNTSLFPSSKTPKMV